MASATPTSTAAASADGNILSLPTDAISYSDLYARWERGNWKATELDFSEDARQWREDFTEFERTAAMWNYCLFFWGEDAVADNLSPYIDAAPLEEQKYFLTTQQVDEARHAVFFKRFMQEVCEVGDGSMASGLNAIKPQLTPGFRKIFDRLDTMADELRKDHSPAKLAAAVTLYHIVIEASLAQPGQHFICSYLEERDQLPAFREGMENIATDEQRHIGFGVKLLSDLKREDPVRVPKAVAGILHEVTRYTSQVLMPPGWDERYVTVFNSTLDEVGVEGLTSMTTKLRSAGMPLESLPGPKLLPGALAGGDLPAWARACQGRRDRRAPGPLHARPRDARAAVRHDPPPGQPRARPVAPDDLPVGVHRSRRADVAPDRQQRLEHGRPGGGAEARRAPAARLPGLDRPRRRARRPAAADRPRAASAEGQPTRTAQAGQGLPPRLSLVRRRAF